MFISNVKVGGKYGSINSCAPRCFDISSKHLPDHIPSAKAMDDLKDDVPKLPEHRLFVTEKNYAVFGESTRRGMITQNCYESIVDSGIELPEWFQQPNGEYVTLGKL